MSVLSVTVGRHHSRSVTSSVISLVTSSTASSVTSWLFSSPLSASLISKKKAKYRRLRTYTTSDSDSETDRSAVSATQELEGGLHANATQWQQQLSSMFPASTSLQLRAAVAAASKAGNLEAGVDYLVRGNFGLSVFPTSPLLVSFFLCLFSFFAGFVYFFAFGF